MEKEAKEMIDIMEYIGNIKSFVNDEEISKFKKWCIKNHYEKTALINIEIIQDMMKERNEEIKRYYLNLR